MLKSLLFLSTPERHWRRLRSAMALLLLLQLTGCANFLSNLVPDVYLVDRHTVMEADAAGAWPDLEARLLYGDLATGPLPLVEQGEGLEQHPDLQLLNAEFPQSTPR
ncbi:hypothetical protein V6U78_06985 [Marinospirillum sp. MEB164]|uniref:Uncharacterized protein n=1 Tax=Marinospirillum alkalitolerans TaxID=3123374 RepID=A0ABW8PY27_9GAMM